jgi:hypothetical protein
MKNAFGREWEVKRLRGENKKRLKTAPDTQKPISCLKMVGNTINKTEMTMNLKSVSPTSSVLRCWLDREIDSVLHNYFSKPQNQSKIYWPKSLRLFLKYLFEQLEREATVEILSEFKTERSLLEKFIKDLDTPTTFYISVRIKKQIGDALRRIRFRQCLFTIRKPRYIASGLPVIWPQDIIDPTDLNESPASINLRRDVKDYIWNLVKNTFPDCKFAISFSQNDSPSIKLEVEPDLVVRIRTLLDERSSAICDVCELLPNELIEVVSLENVKSIEVHKEMLTSGSQWNGGTIGGVLLSQDGLIGITCGHVVSGTEELSCY